MRGPEQSGCRAAPPARARAAGQVRPTVNVSGSVAVRRGRRLFRPGTPAGRSPPAGGRAPSAGRVLRATRGGRRMNRCSKLLSLALVLALPGVALADPWPFYPLGKGSHGPPSKARQLVIRSQAELAASGLASYLGPAAGK